MQILPEVHFNDKEKQKFYDFFVNEYFSQDLQLLEESNIFSSEKVCYLYPSDIISPIDPIKQLSIELRKYKIICKFSIDYNLESYFYEEFNNKSNISFLVINKRFIENQKELLPSIGSKTSSKNTKKLYLEKINESDLLKQLDYLGKIYASSQYINENIWNVIEFFYKEDKKYNDNLVCCNHLEMIRELREALNDTEISNKEGLDEIIAEFRSNQQLKRKDWQEKLIKTIKNKNYNPEENACEQRSTSQLDWWGYTIRLLVPTTLMKQNAALLIGSVLLPLLVDLLAYCYYKLFGLPNLQNKSTLRTERIGRHPPFNKDIFISRPEYEEKLLKIFNVPPDSCTENTQEATFYGLSGVGKTQLALNYYLSPKYNYTYVFWVEAMDEIKIINSYIEMAIALNLSLSPHSIEKIILRNVVNELQNRPGWLLVFNGVNDDKLLVDVMPSRGGHVLITAYNNKWKNPIKISIFERIEAINLYHAITNKTEKEDDKTIGNLVEDRLGRLPLAIAQAAAFIYYENITCFKYIDFYDSQKMLMLNDRTMPPNTQHDPIAITWNLNFERIQNKSIEDNLPAIAILRYCAFLKSAQIPRLLILYTIFIGKKLDVCTAESIQKLYFILPENEFNQDAKKSDQNLQTIKFIDDETRNALDIDRESIIVIVDIDSALEAKFSLALTLIKYYALIDYDNEYISMHQLVRTVIQSDTLRYNEKANIVFFNLLKSMKIFRFNQIRKGDYSSIGERVADYKELLEFANIHLNRSHLNQRMIFFEMARDAVDLYETFSNFDDIVRLLTPIKIEMENFTIHKNINKLYTETINLLAIAYRRKGNIPKYVELLTEAYNITASLERSEENEKILLQTSLNLATAIANPYEKLTILVRDFPKIIKYQCENCPYYHDTIPYFQSLAIAFEQHWRILISQLKENRQSPNQPFMGSRWWYETKNVLEYAYNITTVLKQSRSAQIAIEEANNINIISNLGGTIILDNHKYIKIKHAYDMIQKTLLKEAYFIARHPGVSPEYLSHLLRDMTIMYIRLNDFIAAGKYNAEELQVNIKCYGENSLKVAETYKYNATIELSLKNCDKAYQASKKAYSIVVNYLEYAINHTETISCNNLTDHVRISCAFSEESPNLQTSDASSLINIRLQPNSRFGQLVWIFVTSWAICVRIINSLIKTMSFDRVLVKPSQSLKIVKQTETATSFDKLNSVDSFSYSQNNARPLYDAGRWDPSPYTYPETGEPVFIYRVFQAGKEVGTAHFYKHPLFCKSDDGTRHNLLSTTGIISQFKPELVLDSTEEICVALPPTLLEKVISIKPQHLLMTTIQSVGYGTVSGLAKTGKYGIEKWGSSPLKANIAQYIIYYNGLFLKNFFIHYYQPIQHMRQEEQFYSFALHAAIETAQIALMQASLDQVGQFLYRSGRWAESYGYPKSAYILNKLSVCAYSSKCVYDVYYKGPTLIFTAIMTSVITESTIEKIGKKVIDSFLSNHVRALIPKVNRTRHLNSEVISDSSIDSQSQHFSTS